MSKFRCKSWFRVTPKVVVLDAERCERIGTNNLIKLVRRARKHKTCIHMLTQRYALSPEITMYEKDYLEYKQLLDSIGVKVNIIKDSAMIKK